MTKEQAAQSIGTTFWIIGKDGIEPHTVTNFQERRFTGSQKFRLVFGGRNLDAFKLYDSERAAREAYLNRLEDLLNDAEREMSEAIEKRDDALLRLREAMEAAGAPQSSGMKIL